jgi:hypothetical protein
MFQYVKPAPVFGGKEDESVLPSNGNDGVFFPASQMREWRNVGILDAEEI